LSRSDQDDGGNEQNHLSVYQIRGFVFIEFSCLTNIKNDAILGKHLIRQAMFDPI
jgi:hypothetical protein